MAIGEQRGAPTPTARTSMRPRPMHVHSECTTQTKEQAGARGCLTNRCTINANLAADGELELEGCRRTAPPQHLRAHALTQARLAVGGIKRRPLCLAHRWSPADDADVDGAVAPLEERGALREAGGRAARHPQQRLRLVAHLAEQRVQDALKLPPSLIADLLDDALAVEELLAAEGMHAVLGKAEVQPAEQPIAAQLALLLHEVTGTHDAHEIAALPKPLQHTQDLLRRRLCGHGQCSIDVEQHERRPRALAAAAKQVGGNRGARDGRKQSGAHRQVTTSKRSGPTYLSDNPAG